MSDEGPAIVIDPDPPVAGKELRVWYTGALPVELVIAWQPAQEPTSVFINSGLPGWGVVTVPGNATGLNLHDPNGLAADLARVI